MAYVKTATVRRSGLCRLEDCNDKRQYKHLKTNENENWWIEKRMYGLFHSDFEDKTDREKRRLWNLNLTHWHGLNLNDAIL